MFRKMFLLLPLFFLPAASCFSQIKITPASHDFGEVRPGNHYTCKAKVTNTSSKTVTLSAPVMSGHDALATVENNVLKPKTSTWMTLRYTPEEGQKGPQFSRALFNVTYGGAKKGETIGVERGFEVKAQVKPYYTLTPGELVAAYMNGQKASGVVGRLDLDAKACADWKLVKADASSNTLTVRMDPLTKPLSYSVRLGIPAGLPPGTYQGKILIQGSGKTADLIQYPYHIVVNSLFDVEPRYLQLGSLDPKSPVEWKGMTQVRRIDGKEFKIQKIENAPSWLNYDIQKAPGGQGYLIHWKLDRGKLQDKKEREKPLPQALTLVTDSKLEKSIPISVDALWPGEKVKIVKMPSSWLARPQGTPLFFRKPMPESTPGILKKDKR